MFPPFSDLQAGKLVFVQTVRLVVCVPGELYFCSCKVGVHTVCC